MKAAPVSSPKRRRTAGRVLTALVLGASLLAALYIMVNGLGLIDSLDFGAGAYYYADIPAFEKFVNNSAYTSETPMWVLIVLFLVWGGLMYRLWAWAEKHFSQGTK